jgi:hypothetical protein
VVGEQSAVDDVRQLPLECAQRLHGALAFGELALVVVAAGTTAGSMGRVASAGDNAAMESFFNLLQTNVLDRQRWQTREELRYAVIHWIEHTYNPRRRQRGLGKLTPVEFELAFTPQNVIDADVDAA